MYLGIDLGSSSIKLTLLDAETGTVKASVAHPEEELKIEAPNPGWAEQDPEMWWTHFLEGFRLLRNKSGVSAQEIKAIGISYQMHGLVLVDNEHNVLRPSIIWCDSRAVDIGNEAFKSLGRQYSLSHLLNSPGNFTASKLAWVKNNEPDTFAKIHKFMLPGDYLAMRLTGEITTTQTGLSEGTFWDFQDREVSKELLSHYDISPELIPEVVPAIGAELKIDADVATQLGVSKDVVLTYRAGDQPNNAFSLNVLNPGEIAATAGTSGVIYAVTDRNVFDNKSRINTFLHVNDEVSNARNGVLICINGTGILYSWMKKLLNTGSGDLNYERMNDLAGSVDPGAGGVLFFPFGNGAERIFENKLVGAHLLNMDFNRHQTKHILRAGLEGIVYAMNLGFEMLADLDVPGQTIRVGKSNLFLSKAFREIFANVTGIPLELYNTDGAAGAARGAALGQGFYSSAKEAFEHLERLEVIEPEFEQIELYKELFNKWENQSRLFLNQKNKIEEYA